MTTLLIACSSVSSAPNSLETTSSVVQSKTEQQSAIWQGNNVTIWNQLQRVSSSRLAVMQTTTSDPTQTGWIQLALMSKRYSTNTQQLARELLAFREQYPSHPGNQLIPNNTTLNNLLNSQPPKHIALLLPLQGTYGSSGQAVRDGFLSAYYNNLPKIGKQGISFYDTAQTNDIYALYQQAIAEGADFIIGPLTKENVQQLIKSGSFSYPTLALNYTETGFGGLPSNLYEFGLLPEDEATQLAERAKQAGLSHALVIAPESPWGNRLVAAFSTAWQHQGGTIQETWYYTPRTDYNQGIAQLLKINLTNDQQLSREGNDRSTLEQQRRQDFDVIFLFAQPKQGRIIVPLLRYYYVTNTPIYATSAIYAGTPNPTKDVDLNGVTVCDIPKNLQIARGDTSNPQADRLYAVGQDAYLLSQTLTGMTTLPNFPVYGKTGALTLASSDQIHRRLPCATIQNGRL